MSFLNSYIIAIVRCATLVLIVMESKKKHSIDEKILSTFWDLVETDEEKRIVALEVLLTALIEKQGDVSWFTCAGRI